MEIEGSVMDITGVSSGSNPNPAGILRGKGNQARQQMHELGAALKLGDLSGAKVALSALQRQLQEAGPTGPRPALSPGGRNQVGTDLETLERQVENQVESTPPVATNNNIETAPKEPHKPNPIPADKRTKPMTKKAAARHLGRTGDESRAVEWLNKCIEDGLIRHQETSRQSGIYHLDDFPEDKHRHIKP